MKENTQSKPPFQCSKQQECEFWTRSGLSSRALWHLLTRYAQLLPGLLALFVSAMVLRKSPLISWSDWAAEPSAHKELGQLSFIAGYLLPWPNQITSLIAQFLYLQHRNGHVFLNPSQWPVNENHNTRACTISFIISEVMLGVLTLWVCTVTGEKQKSSLNKGCVQATVV